MKAPSRSFVADELSNIRLHKAEGEVMEVGFLATEYHVLESAGTVSVKVERFGPVGVPFSVDYSTEDMSAVSGKEYHVWCGVGCGGPAGGFPW